MAKSRANTNNPMRINVTMALVAASMMFASCAKDGPEGPVGPAGAQGNANVRSETFSISPGDWSTTGAVYAFNWGTSLITESIVNTGAVLMYTKVGDTWQALPATVNGWATVYHYGVGHVQLETTPPAAPNQVTQWKVVVIASSGMIRGSGIDATSYEAVRDHFGLDE